MLKVDYDFPYNVKERQQERRKMETERHTGERERESSQVGYLPTCFLVELLFVRCLVEI